MTGSERSILYATTTTTSASRLLLLSAHSSTSVIFFLLSVDYAFFNSFSLFLTPQVSSTGGKRTVRAHVCVTPCVSHGSPPTFGVRKSLRRGVVHCFTAPCSQCGRVREACFCHRHHHEHKVMCTAVQATRSCIGPIASWLPQRGVVEFRV